MLPERVSLTQDGAVTPESLIVLVPPPVVERHCKIAPFPGVIKMAAYAEFITHKNQKLGSAGELENVRAALAGQPV